MKKKLLIILLLLCLVLTAYAAGTRITLDSSKPMAEQIDAFRDWYDGLSFLDKAQWDLAFHDLTDPDRAFAEFENQSLGFADTTEDENEQYVYVLPKGSVYHLSPNCKYVKNKNNVQTIPISQTGTRKPCSVCGK